MVAKAIDHGRPNWRLPFYVAIVELVVLILIALCQFDTAFFLQLFFVAPTLLLISLVLVVLLILAALGYGRHQLLPFLATLAILWAIPTPLFFYEREHPAEIRGTARWLVWSHEYKQQVLRQRTPANGELKYVEWDGWGYPGAGNTSVYLVFDPTDSLLTAAKSRNPGKFNGVPCKVPLVRRLESHWYAVLFYTDQTWNQCD